MASFQGGTQSLNLRVPYCFESRRRTHNITLTVFGFQRFDNSLSLLPIFGLNRFRNLREREGEGEGLQNAVRQLSPQEKMLVPLYPLLVETQILWTNGGILYSL